MSTAKHGEAIEALVSLAPRFVVAASLAFSSGAVAQDEYSMLVFGDSGTGRQRQRRVAHAMSQACEQHGCDAALVLGDLIYPRGVSSVDDNLFQTHFEEPYEVVGPFPFWMSPGNHDHKRTGSVDAQVAYSRSGKSARWTMPAPHYPVEGLPDWLHVYALDTKSIAAGFASAEQADRATAALCGKPGWRLLMGHHPIYSNGRHGDNPAVGSYVEEVIQECDVQAYFAGHDHHQEHISAPSLEQFVQGAAAKRRAVRTASDRAQRPTRQQFARSTLGFAIATFTDRTMEVRFFDGTDGRAHEIYRCGAAVDSPGCVPQ